MLLGAGKRQDRDSPLEPPEGTGPAHTLVLGVRPELADGKCVLFNTHTYLCVCGCL